MTYINSDQPKNLRKGLGALGTATEQFWGRFINPPDSVTDIVARRKAQLSASISILLFIVVVIGFFASSGFQEITNPSNTALLVIAIGLVFAYLVSRTKYFSLGSLILVISLAASGYGLVFLNPAPSDLVFAGGIYSTIPLSLVFGSVLLSLPWLILLTAANFVIIAMAPLILPVISFHRAGADSWNILGLGVVLVLTVVFRNALERYRLNEVRETNKQLKVAVQELNTNREMLEVRVTERTFDLERRNRQIEAVTEVSRVASSILDTDVLIRQVVELIQNSFDLYYVGIFLVDERNEWAVLRAGTGEAGRLMLARGHRIRIGEGMVGWCIANARARVALETQEDTVRRSTTELPDTRSEAALPLTSHDRVLGALTVQSEKSGVFDQGILVLLQAMSDQVAVALDNARLYTESQEAVRALRRSYGESSRQGWVDTLRSQPVMGYISDPKGVYSVQPDEEPMQNPAKGEILKIPVKVRDQVLGSIQAQKEETGQEWTQDEIEMLETLVDQLSVALENARLYEDTQRRAERERVAADISARIRESLDVDTVLRTAVMEMRRALNLDEITIRLGESNGQ
ncbi:MAG: hypothetical protein A2032_03290 [Chloroflexi bacterium RBG_19FT_COMBO_49_13]|nr:MAG: hypothetical protein A2032_03290 [Chloroflexi bacterium RBG_19FT_COMBO_49_13]